MVKKSGLGEVEWAEVLAFHQQFCKSYSFFPSPSQEELGKVLLSLAAMRLVACEGSRMGYFQRVRPMLTDEDLEVILKADDRLGKYVK